MKVLIIDDHALFREGLRYLLRSMTDDLEYVEAENLKRLPDLSREHPEVDLILLDLNIGGTDGLVAIGDLQTLWQETPIVIVTASERQEDIERAMAAGAASFIPKTVSSDAMVSALERVARGESYVPDLSKASGEAEKNGAARTDDQPPNGYPAPVGDRQNQSPNQQAFGYRREHRACASLGDF